MQNGLIKYAGLFILLIFLQLFLFNNIQLSGYINPYFYILFILLLPYDTPGWLLLLLGFFTGLAIDAFMNSHGVHSSATLLMAFLRPYVLNYLSERGEIENKGIPSMSQYGFSWFFRYATILTVAHHLVLFLIESFTFVNLGATLWRTILSSLTTLAFILITQLLFTHRK
ncbi:MAG TPA: rod shape-determining protein MreD [Tenuifilaceae bacterium]|nr:rod shape-determining protein MreD [Tenuifilaceae bacterium]